MLKETVEKFTEIYKTKKDTVDWMEKYGTEFERLEATIIKNVALNN